MDEIRQGELMAQYSRQVRKKAKTKPFSQATTGAEKMETLNMGDYTFHTSGTKYFKMSLTAVSSNGGKNLSTNYLKLTLQ